MSLEYVPTQGDVVTIRPVPAAEGYEQAKGRPWLVISSRPYHAKIGLMLAVPLTTSVKGYPFEVPLEGARNVSGVALADQLQCLDWHARNTLCVDHVPPQVVADVGAKIAVIVKVRAGG